MLFWQNARPFCDVGFSQIKSPYSRLLEMEHCDVTAAAASHQRPALISVQSTLLRNNNNLQLLVALVAIAFGFGTTRSARDIIDY